MEEVRKIEDLFDKLELPRCIHRSKPDTYSGPIRTGIPEINGQFCLESAPDRGD